MQKRRLTAIMFTDIVGYTALMGSDEDHAFAVLTKNREIHSKLIEQFNGTLIKEMGDGMLIGFNLASDAVRCAIEIQKACKDQEIPLKIGIHEGEMVFADYDAAINAGIKYYEIRGDCAAIIDALEKGYREGGYQLALHRNAEAMIAKSKTEYITPWQIQQYIHEPV